MSSKNPERPNIICILSDDQGPWAMGCAGNKEILTPNLDSLAASGIRFDSFFCTSPVCSPARASLLTGTIPSRHGVHDWIYKGNTGDDAIEYLKGFKGYTDYLAENGYQCGISGKWHLGDSFRPQKGFSHWYVHEKGGSPYYDAPMIREGKLINEPGYITDNITDDALAYLEKCSANGSPFYLSVNYTAPHSPWINNHPKEILELYNECTFKSCPQEPAHPWDTFPSGKEIRENPREYLKGYFAAVTAMDMNIGRILAKLDELKLRKDTLVCFMSDNGFSCGHHGVWGKGNGTFPFNMYENSVKVPAIFSHPGHIPSGKVCSEMVSAYDFMPTILDYTGIPLEENIKLPGRSFKSLLKGEEAKVREAVVVFDEYGPVRMIRTKEWKYIHRYPDGPDELYNLTNDPDERNNLADRAPSHKMAGELRCELEKWFSTYSDSDVDGSFEPVTGFGQIDLAGKKGKGNSYYIP